MTPEQFRQHGHEVVDWIADYWTRIGSLPVRSQVSPGEVRASLPTAAPERGEPFSAVLADLDRVVLPGVTHWQHPGFFGYFPANTSGPSVLGDLVSAGLGVQGMSWVTSPAATELEQHVMDWLADLLGLPASFRSDGPGGGVVQDSSSGAQPGRPAGGPAPVEHAARRSGRASTPTGRPSTSRRRPTRRWRRPSASPVSARDAVRIVEVDGDLAMRPAALAARLERDVARGYTPVLVCATVGTTSTTAVDPLAEIGPICQRVRRLAARRRRLRRGQRRRPRAAPAAGRGRVGRQLHHRRAQVAAHRLRRDPLLDRRPGGAHRRPVDPAGVPAQRRHRRRRRRRLPRLADPARPPLPRAQAVVRPPLVRRRGAARPHPRARRAGPGAGRLGRGRRAFRRRRAASVRRWSACGPAGPTTWTPTSRR